MFKYLSYCMSNPLDQIVIILTLMMFLLLIVAEVFMICELIYDIVDMKRKKYKIQLWPPRITWEVTENGGIRWRQ